MDQFKKGGKLQNSNLFATNRLFAKNPLFKKRKKKAPGIYNPNAKYKYPDGGLVQGGESVCPSGYEKDAYGECVQTTKEVVVKLPKSKKINPTVKKLNILRKKLEYFDSQNNGLGPTSMSDIIKRSELFKQIAKLEAQNQDALKHTPRLDQAQAVGNTMLTLGKYFMPEPVKKGINYFLNVSDAYDYTQDPNNENNKLSVASDVLSPLKSTKTKVAPFSVISDVINLKQQYDKFEKAKKQRYADGGGLLTKKVTCKKCGWKWDAADGGNDITTCHKCGGQGLVHAQGGGNISISKLNQIAIGDEPKSNRKFKKDLMKEYPGMQDVYGRRGQKLRITEDPNYVPSQYSDEFGSIEFMRPHQPPINYTEDYSYASPHPRKYNLIYNSEGANRGDMFLDMMHGMRDDKNYMVLLNNLAAEVRKARGGDMDYYYEEALRNGYSDGREQWDDNYIDGILRSELNAIDPLAATSFDKEGYAMERQHNSDAIKNSVQDIYGYIKTKHKTGGAASPKDLDPEHMKKYLAELRNQENDARRGYRNGMWYPHRSVEGGADTIAYGHKLTPNDAYLRKGITEVQANALQEQDVLKNQALAKKQVDKKFGVGTFDSLPQDSQMLLVDYQYNLGTLSGFPSFVKATVEGNKEGMLKEHKRYGAGIPLTRRNDWTASVINNMNVPEPFDPNQITIPLGNIPDNTTVVNPIPVQPLPEIPIPPNAKGGEIELDIPESEIAFYVNGGYVVEDISVPSLNRMDNGGTIYTYSGNPNASYKKIGEKWYISSKATGNSFVPINDPNGKRAAELNKNAVVLPGQPAPVEQPRGVQGNVGPAKLPGQAKMELSSATRTAPTVQNQEKIKTLKAEVKKESDQAAEIARKKQIEKEKEAAALLLAQSNPSDNPNGINQDVVLPQPSKLGYEFDQDKERYLRNLEINQALNSGNAALLLGDTYRNQNDLSLRDMVAQGFAIDPGKFEKATEDADKFRNALNDAGYNNFLKKEQEAYNKLGLLDKGLNEAANFLADPVYTGGQWLGGNRTLVGQGTGVRDDNKSEYQYYNRATGIQDDWANNIFNFVNPGSNGASARVHWDNGDVVGFGGDMLSLALKAKIGTQGLKATSAEFGDVLKQNILGTGLTGNHLLKGYTAYEGATKYVPRATTDLLNYAETGKSEDLLDALYSTGKVASAYLPFTKFNDANVYPVINEVKSAFGGLDSSVKGLGDQTATDYHFKTVEKANKLAKQLGQAKDVAVDKATKLKNPIALATFLRFAKPQKTGGSVETELTEQEIQDLIAQGYVIEQV